MEGRSPSIDYLRAFSILWVVWYHFCSISIFKTGFYGVVLFFAISGYCIAHSAMTSASAWHFYAKRVGRLMPALIVCSFITVSFKHVAPNLIDPIRHVPWRDLFYSWFAMPTLNLPGSDYLPADWAYWSLLVEFRFYVVIFVVMLLGFRRYLLLSVCVYTIAYVVLARVSRDIDFYPFFIAGISVAEIRSGRRLSGAIGLLFAFVLDLFFLLNDYTQPSAPISLWRSIVLWLGTAAIFAATSLKPPPWMERLLVPFAYIGLVSYPMYLIHQDAGMMILRFCRVEYSDRLTPRLVALIVVPIVLTIVAGAIHTWVERPWIKPLIAFLTRSQEPRAYS